MAPNDRCENNAGTGPHRKDMPLRQSDGSVRPLSYKVIADCLLSLKEQICQDKSTTRNVDYLIDLLDTAISEYTGATTARLPLITDACINAIERPFNSEKTYNDSDSKRVPAASNNIDEAREPTESIEASIDRCQTTINLDPLNYGVYFNLGFYLRIAGRYKEASNAFLSFLTFANTDDGYDLHMVHQALKWLRYLDRKMELFGNCRSGKETTP